MNDYFRKIHTFLSTDMWQLDTGTLSRFRALLVYVTKLVYLTFREYTQNELTLRAMGLVYTTLLSIVPLLAFSVSILKAFGVVENQLEPFLLSFLEPLGSQGQEISAKILEFINKINFGVLGVIGLLMLIYTSISLIKKIEDSLNLIWKLKKGRSIARRFSDYISTLLIGPVLMFAALALTASFESNAIVQKVLTIEAIGVIFYIFAKILPYLIIILVFTFIYLIIPNTKVKMKSALIGGIIAGIAWQTTGWVFTVSVARSTKYAAIYSSLAVLIIFMIWVYINWLILLIGAQIAYCHQNLEILDLGKITFKLSNRLRERLSLMLIYMIGYNYYHGKERLSQNELAQRLEIPDEAVAEIIYDLESSNIIIDVADEPASYIPSRDIESITLKEVLEAVREDRSSPLMDENLLSQESVNSVIKDVENAIYGSLGDSTVRDLVLASDNSEPPEEIP